MLYVNNIISFQLAKVVVNTISECYLISWLRSKVREELAGCVELLYSNILSDGLFFGGGGD